MIFIYGINKIEIQSATDALFSKMPRIELSTSIHTNRELKSSILRYEFDLFAWNASDSNVQTVKLSNWDGFKTDKSMFFVSKDEIQNFITYLNFQKANLSEPTNKVIVEFISFLTQLQSKNCDVYYETQLALQDFE